METDLDDQTMSRDLTNASEPQVAEFEPGILDTYIAYHLRLAQKRHRG